MSVDLFWDEVLRMAKRLLSSLAKTDLKENQIKRKEVI